MSITGPKLTSLTIARSVLTARCILITVLFGADFNTNNDFVIKAFDQKHICPDILPFRWQGPNAPYTPRPFSQKHDPPEPLNKKYLGAGWFGFATCHRLDSKLASAKYIEVVRFSSLSAPSPAVCMVPKNVLKLQVFDVASNTDLTTCALVRSACT